MEQYIEGTLAGCKGSKCEFSCCDDDKVEEWFIEYALFHDKIKDHLISKGIKINFNKDRVNFTKCSENGQCKFLKYALDKTIDPRPLDCKIFPFAVDWDSIDFDKKIVLIYYWDETCPLVKNRSISEEFKQEVVHLVKRDFALLFHGLSFEVKFVDKDAFF